MAKTFFIAKVTWDPFENSKTKADYSLYAAKNYQDAMDKVIIDYGDDIASIELTPCSDNLGEGMLVSESLANALIQGLSEEIVCQPFENET